MTKKPIKRVVLRASNPSPRATNLEGYTKFTIPWNDGTGENLYVWIKPDESSQTVYIGSDENLKIQTRQKNLVFKTNTAGVVSAYQSQATLEVIQTNAVYNYRLILSSTSTSVHAAGAELPLTAQLEAKIGDEIIYTKAVEATFTLEDSEGFTLQGSTLSVANRGTYIGNQRSCIVSAVVNAPETGEEVFGNLQINQEGNYIEEVEWEGGSFSYDGIGAGATSATPKVTEMTPRFHYTSGQSSAVVPSSTYGTWEVPAVAYSLAKSQNGFTAVNTNTGVLTATHRGTTIGNARASATVSRLKSGTWTPSANFNAKGSKTAEDTLTATCTQAKNVPTAITSVPLFSYATGALAPYGGTKNVSVSGKVTITWSSGSTSKESTSGAKAGFSVQGTRTYSMVAATGFSINSSTGAVTAATMGTTLGSRSSGNVTSTLKWVLTINDTYGGGELTDSKSSTLTTPVTQGVNERTQVFAKPNILTFTAADIPASGGTVSSGTITYKQLSTWDYTSGATSTGPEYTTGGTITYGDPVSAESLGTTAKARTEVGILTATVTLNGQTSAEGEVAVFQAANAITEYGDVSLTVQTPITCDVGGGEYRIDPIYSQTIKYTSGATRAGNVSVTYTQKAAMTGFSLEGNIVTVTENKTTSARNGYTVTVKATGEGSKTASKDVVFNQSLGVKSYATPVITGFTYPTIAAKGGTVTPTVTYSQTWGWNESTTNGGTITSGAALSFSGTGVNTSTGAVTAGTKGTTVSSATNVTTATVKVTLNNKAATKTFTVQQAANAITSYGNVTISGGSVSDIPANGGSVSSMSGISASQTITYTSESTRAGTVKITYSTAISGTNLGTTIKNRTKLGTLTATATGEGSKTATKALDVYQAKNVPTKMVATANFSYPTGAIPASGGTKSPTPAGKANITWSSGGTNSLGGGNYTGYTIGSSRTYSMVAATGFSINTSTGVVTATNRGTTEGAARSCGNVSSTLNMTLTISDTYGGGTISDSDTDTLTTPITQQANTATYGNVTLNASNPATVAATGGTVTISASASQTVSFTSGATRAGNVSLTYTQKTAVSGFSLSGNKVTVTANSTTSTRSYVVTVKATGEGSKTASKEVTVSQATGAKSYSDITLNVSYPTIAAKGGTVTPTVSYSQTWGWNGSTTGGGTITSGGTVTYSGTSVSTSNGAVTAGTKGTNVSGVTTVTTATVKVTLNGKTTQKQVTVQQAANAITSYGAVTISGSLEDISASGGAVSEQFAKDSGTAISYNEVYTSGATLQKQTNLFNGLDYDEIDSSMSPYIMLECEDTTGKAESLPWQIDSLGTTVKNRTKLGTMEYFLLIPGYEEPHSAGTLDIYQQANAITGTTYSNPTVTISSVADIPAKGGSVSTGTATYSQTKTDTYTSGSSKPTTITSGGTVKWSTVSAGTKGTTVSARTEVDEITCTVTLNSKSGSATKMVYQAANSKNEVSRVITVSVPSGDIPAEGGTKTVTRSGVINYSFTSGSTTTSSFTPTLSISGTGFSLNGTTVTAANRLTTVGERRSATVTASYEGATSKTATVYQEANAAISITYGTPVFVTTEVDLIPASGGTVSSFSTLQYSQSRVQNYTSGATSTLSNATSGATVTYSDPVSADDLGTIAMWQAKVGTLTCTITMNGKSASKTMDVEQQANSVSYGRVTISGTGSVADIPAGGGSVSTASGYTASQTISYTSKHTRAGRVRFTYSTVSADSLGKTEKARTSVGTMKVTATGEGSQRATTTITVYQEANVKTTGDISYGDWQVSVYAREYISASSPCPASGDSFTIYSSASRTRVQNYNYTSGETDTETLSTETATPELSVSGEGGLTLDGNTATYANRGTTEGNLRSNTILATYEGAYDTEQVYQEENVKTEGSISYGTWQVSVSANRYTTTSSPCPASGGTCTITASASRTRTQNYSFTSGATSTSALTNESGNPTLSISGTGASLSGTTVTWANRTTIEGSARSATVTATMDTVATTEVVYQAENVVEENVREWGDITDVYPEKVLNFSSEAGSIETNVHITQAYQDFDVYSSGSRKMTANSSAALGQDDTLIDVSESLSWVTAVVTNTIVMYVTVTANTSTSDRSGSITISGTGHDGKTYSKSITVSQGGKSNYLNVSPTSLSFTASGGTQTITIDTNESWTIS